MTVVVFAALVWKVIDFLRMLFNFKTNKSAIVTQFTAWVGGVALVLIAAQAQVTQALVLPGSDQALGVLDVPSLILLGLLVSSLASGVVDLKQAFDNTDSSSKPPLVSQSEPVIAQAPPAGQ